MMDRKTETRDEVFTGIPASPGIAIGNAFVVNVEELPVGEEHVPGEKVEEEVSRFEGALREADRELYQLHKRLKDDMGEEHARILDSHRLIVTDKDMQKNTIKLIREEQLSAASAFSRVIDRVLTSFDEIEDQYLKERGEDIRDVRSRVVRILLGQKEDKLTSLDRQAVVVARNLTPSDTMGLKKKYVKAYVTDVGGRTSHAAIVARSQGIPSVVGLNDFCLKVRPNDRIIVDGITGQVVLNPTPEKEKDYREARARYQEMERELLTLKDYPAVTLDGKTIELSGNIEVLDEVDDLLSHGGRGIGLFRTEYFFITSETLPSEEEQYRYYREVIEKVAPDPVIIRTLDVGGDKIAGWVAQDKENNPFMGWRGIRFTLSRRDIFRTQLRAIFRAAVHGKIRVMFPMISVIEEVRSSLEICEEVKEDLKNERYRIDEDVEMGIMIETPAAVAMADNLAKEVDFFSIGTNDLIQYVLAVDRGNSRISYLYDALHPSILKMLKDTVEAAHRNGIWVGICGEMPADVFGALLLIGLGLDEFSAGAYILPEIKSIIRSVTYDETKALAGRALKCSTVSEVKSVLTRFVDEKRPELKEFIRK